MSVFLSDFYPRTNWTIDSKDPTSIIDRQTSRSYIYESPNIIRVKCLALSAITPFIQGIMMLASAAFRFIRLTYNFGVSLSDKNVYNPRLQMLHSIELIGDIVAIPVVLLSLEVSAIYGIVFPYDGRKLYASFERYYYSTGVIAPCFQPTEIAIATQL